MASADIDVASADIDVAGADIGVAENLLSNSHQLPDSVPAHYCNSRLDPIFKLDPIFTPKQCTPHL